MKIRVLPAQLVIVLLVGSMAVSGCSAPGLLITPVSTNRELEERVVAREGRFVRDKIAVIDVSGILLNMHTPGLLSEGEHPVSLLREKLDVARHDNNVKAVILRINSPGGTVTASELMYDEIMTFRKATHKPVYALMMDVAASGGYYIACACDHITAYESTVTGSIGVIMQLFDVTGTMTKIGVKTEAITSGEFKDAGSPFKWLSDEEREIFQGIVDNFYDQFVRVVADGRPFLDENSVRTVADGRIYSARDAVSVGLVDQIGSMRSTIVLLKQRLELSRVKVVMYDRPLGYRPNYYAEAPAGTGTQINLLNVNLPEWTPPTPRFLYLWQPGVR